MAVSVPLEIEAAGVGEGSEPLFQPAPGRAEAPLRWVLVLTNLALAGITY